MNSKKTIWYEIMKAYMTLTLLVAVFFLLLGFPTTGLGKIYIDINSPSVQKFKIAIPDFKNLEKNNQHPELSQSLPAVLSSDLDISGYFSPMDKGAFLEEGDASLGLEKTNLKNWSVIGADLLITGAYTCIGSSIEVKIRLFDVFWGQQELVKTRLGDIDDYRSLMHTLSNDILRKLTWNDGICLTKITFDSNASGYTEIYTSDYDGHNVRQVTADKNIALFPRWSPDGKKILYNSYRGGGLEMYLMDLSTQHTKLISGRSGMNSGVSWAPDGKSLAITLDPKGNPDIFLIDLNGRIIRQLTSHWEIDTSPSFSPDGKKIAFVSGRSGSPQIYVLDLEQGTTRRLTFNGTYNTSPSWSCLDRIAFVSRNNGKFNIWTMDPSGRGRRKMTEDQGNNEEPAWSPDGRYLIFSSDRTGNYDLYIMNAAGKSQSRITVMDGDQSAPSWAP